MSTDFFKQGVLNENYRISAAFTRERRHGMVRRGTASSDGACDDTSRAKLFDETESEFTAWVKLDSAEAPE